MTGENQMFAEDARCWYLQQLRRETDPCVLTAAFSEWLRLDVFPETCVSKLRETSFAASGASRRHQDIAAMGFWLGCSMGEATERSAFIAGLDWLRGRSNYVAEGIPSGLLVDWASLLGIAAGFVSLESTEREPFVDWLNGVVVDVADIGKPGDVGASIADLLSSLLKEDRWRCPDEVADVAAALYSRGLVDAEPVKMQEVWRLVLTTEDCSNDLNRYLVRLAALSHLRQRLAAVDLVAPTKEQLLACLNHAGDSFLRWPWESKTRTKHEWASPQKWDLQNEYHFQSYLWAVLKPVFPDLEEETYLPPTGPLQPRADLCLPGLRTVVEVKFWYPSGKISKLVEEIAADHSLYLRDESPYDTMVPVIWDDGARTELHGELQRGLEGLAGMLGVVVVARPSSMKREAQTG